MIDIVHQYGYERGAVIADFACGACQRIVYERTKITEIPERELKSWCQICEKTHTEAEHIATEWWEAMHQRPGTTWYYGSEYTKNEGLYGLRDNLWLWLRGTLASPPKDVLRIAKKLGVTLERPPSR
jgi:hypothetical protein